MIFKNYLSICKIKEYYSINQATMHSLSLRTPEKHLAATNPNKAVGYDNIPPKLK